MKIGDKIEWDGLLYTIKHIEDRNTYEPLPGVKLLGDCVVIEYNGNEIMVYDFDLNEFISEKLQTLC